MLKNNKISCSTNDSHHPTTVHATFILPKYFSITTNISHLLFQFTKHSTNATPTKSISECIRSLLASTKYTSFSQEYISPTNTPSPSPEFFVLPQLFILPQSTPLNQPPTHTTNPPKNSSDS